MYAHNDGLIIAYPDSVLTKNTQLCRPPDPARFSSGSDQIGHDGNDDEEANTLLGEHEVLLNVSPLQVEKH